MKGPMLNKTNKIEGASVSQSSSVKSSNNLPNSPHGKAPLVKNNLKFGDQSMSSGLKQNLDSDGGKGISETFCDSETPRKISGGPDWATANKVPAGQTFSR